MNKLTSKHGRQGILYSLLAGLVLFLLAGCEKPASIPETEAVFVLPETVRLENFEMVNSRLGPFGLEQVRGRWSLFFFGYTFCPDVCPTELFMLSQLMSAIDKDPDTDLSAPQVVFVSVDPQRDTPEALQQYAGYYHSSFIGITGEQSNVDSLAKAMGVFYERVYHSNGEVVEFDSPQAIPAELVNSYLINHSSSIFLLNPAGELHAIFTPPHDPATMIRDLAAIQGAWR